MCSLISRKFSRPIISVLFFLFISSTVNAAVEMEHKPINKAKSGSRISLSAKVVDKEDKVDLVRTYFKAEEESRYFFVPMRREDNVNFFGMLPAPSLGIRVIDYFILVKNAAKKIVKSQHFTINVEDDKEALARMQRKAPRDIRIELDDFEKAQQVIDKKKSLEAEQGTRVPVGSESAVTPTTASVPGFDDYIALTQTSEPLVSATVATVAASAGTVTGVTGLTAGTIAIGAAAVAGAAAVVGGGGGGGGDGDGDGNNPFAGSYTGSWVSNACPTRESGSLRFTVSSRGKVDGSYTGTQTGDIQGSVSSGGTLNASGSGFAGGESCSWNGSLRASGQSISGSGRWNCAIVNCSGTWNATRR